MLEEKNRENVCFCPPGFPRQTALQRVCPLQMKPSQGKKMPLSTFFAPPNLPVPPPRPTPSPRTPQRPVCPAEPRGGTWNCPNSTQNLSQRRGIDPATLASPLLNSLKPPSFRICCWDTYIHVLKHFNLFFFFFSFAIFPPASPPPPFCFTTPPCRGCDA